MKYGFIQTHKSQWPVVIMCRLLGIQRSAYYDWRGKPRRVLPPEELMLRRRMKTLFEDSRGSLGSRMLMNNLRQEGFEIGRERTRRLMRNLSLKVKQKRKFKLTTDSKHQYPIAENILNRDFSPLKPNQSWGADITYLWTQEGWVYLAIVIDLYSRRVVGWSMDRHMEQSLVIRALIMAINLRKPPEGLIHHSDRGSQYCSKAYQALLAQHQMTASMSRKGNCWDNSPIERFFSSLKREWIADRQYQTRQQAISDVREYVAMYYNSKRLHSTLGYTTPMAYEKNLSKVSGNG